MSKSAMNGFTLRGDDRTYRVSTDQVFADNHPIVTDNPELFETVPEIVASLLVTPTGVADSNVAATTATVSWNDVDQATSYTVTTTPATQTYNVTDTTVNLTGLTASTGYTVNVVAKNGDPYKSDSLAGTDTFTTTA